VSPVAVNVYIQENQPVGVPPLALTGERTLPDVPAENYWYRRHLAVYEWIAESVRGLQVIDMACGEGYGAATLAQTAASVIGVDANPEAFEHAHLRYTRPGLEFERALVERYGQPRTCDAVTFLQTIEHVANPEDVLRHFRELLAPGGAVYVSTPNLLTLAPQGAEKSDNPWHLKEYRAHEFRALCESVFETVEMYGLYHAGRLRAHGIALRLGWDRIHRALGLTDTFYGWFTPSIGSRDFMLSDRLPLYRALDFLAVCR
jgi:SAM-dependent methyltransferase